MTAAVDSQPPAAAPSAAIRRAMHSTARSLLSSSAPCATARSMNFWSSKSLHV